MIQTARTNNGQGTTKIGLFGYGSLVNLASLQTTIGRLPDDVQHIYVDGWLRDWSIVCSNNHPRGYFEHAETGEIPTAVLALNIRRAQNVTPERTSINGVVFSVDENDIAALDMRESNYDRVDITADIIGDHSFERVYTYVGRSASLVCDNTDAIVPESYVLLVEQGFREISEAAYLDYLSSTLPAEFAIVPTHYNHRRSMQLASPLAD